ncbi:MAG: lysylphosphatidylglycerol synthase transmembrane domain-containing protein [Proteobacteria bacterium]|nr:lysylphosphatidylglycerol synthase transmembrane domain-containing protein [Pseudomonadota bacterium]
MSKKLLALALKFLVSGFLIWFLISKIDLGEAKERLLDADPLMLAAALLVILIQICVGGLRWQAVMKAIGSPISTLKSIQLFYIGAFFSQILPSSVGGDAVRIYKIYREGIGLRASVNGVLLERAVTVVALVVLVDITFPWFMPRVDAATMKLILPGIIMVTLAGAVGLGFLMMLDRLPEGLRRWRIFRGLGNLGVDARQVFLSVPHLIPVLALGIITHINISFCVFLLAMSLNLDVTWLDCLVLVPPVLLVMTLPISIAGWGVRETAMVAAFGLIGVPEGGAAVLGFLLGLVGIASAAPGGVIWLVSRDKGETMDYPEPDIIKAEET